MDEFEINMTGFRGGSNVGSDEKDVSRQTTSKLKLNLVQ